MRRDDDGARVDGLDRARALRPLLQASAADIEQERRLTTPVLDALFDARLFRMLLPAALGGDEVDPVTFVEVIEEIARGDASTAWCLCQGSGCSMVSAYLSPEVAWEIFGDPRAVLAWGPGPGARAVATGDGYRITGTWSFASGSGHATWLGGYCPIYEPDGTPRLGRGGKPEGRTMLFPVASASIADVWHVIGLRGTGSNSYSVADLFVRHDHSIARDDESERRQPGPLYCFPVVSLYAGGFAGLALGIAGSMLDAFIDLARDKMARGAVRPLRESAVVQADVGLAEAKIRSARTWLLTSLSDIWHDVGRSGLLTLGQRMTIRLASTYAIHQACDVVDTVYQAAGGTAVFAANAFERRFRDMHAVTQQLQGRRSHFETVGQFLLGLDPDTAWL